MDNKQKTLNSESGVSLIITLFVMIIILAVTLSISALLYSEIKVTRNMGNSVESFYAAESGIEKVLFYDRQVIPDGAKRGLCSMFDSVNNLDFYCRPGSSGETSIYCNPPQSPFQSGPIPYNDTSNLLYDSSRFNGSGCDPNVCDDCQISFTTTFDNGANYTTTSEIYPARGDNSPTYFEIESKGIFNGAQRQIQTLTNSIQPKLVNIPVIGVSLNESTHTLTVGDNSFQPFVTIDPSNATNQNVSWTSSNSSVATVDSNGNITPGSVVGTAIITVTTEDGLFTDTDTITVISP